MIEETISQRGTTFVRRRFLESSEATRWPVDLFHRITVVVRGKGLLIEYRDGGHGEHFEVRAGKVDLDEPTPRVHRAVNVGRTVYEEVAIFFLDRPDAIPQPVAP